MSATSTADGDISCRSIDLLLRCGDCICERLTIVDVDVDVDVDAGAEEDEDDGVDRDSSAVEVRCKTDGRGAIFDFGDRIDIVSSSPSLS